MHFQFVLFERMLAKQRWYRATEAYESGAEQAERINKYYIITRDERQLVLEPIRPEWTAGWLDRKIDLENFAEEPLYWYDVEVLRYFQDRGTNYYAAIDLWDADWEQKRLLAKAQGYDGIPEEPIHDPRSPEQRLYHAYLHRFFRIPFWREPKDLAMMPKRWLRALAKSLGVKRSHLEQIGVYKPKPPGPGY
jgi:hypothetical protein